MQLKIKNEAKYTGVYFDGELDEYTAPGVRNTLDEYFESHNMSCVVFDLKGLTFTDSTGIGVFIGRYKKLKTRGVPAYFKNVSAHIDKIFRATNLFSIVPKIEEA